MAFKSKREKYAYVKGIKKGMNGGKPYGRKKAQSKGSKTTNKKRATKGKSTSDNPFGMTYHQMLRERKAQQIDMMGDFDYDSRGRIKGHYTVDGKFEPD